MSIDMFSRVLVPLDGSDVAQMALLYALAIPSESVRLLTVLPPGAVTDSTIEADWREQWQAACEQKLEADAVLLHDQGRNVEIIVAFGDPAEVILAESVDADLVVMTTHGYGAGRRLVFGSVADRLARTSETPLLLIRGGEDPVTAQPIVRIVVALDGSDLAEQAIGLAGNLALAIGVPVLLVRAVDLMQWGMIAQLNASPVARYAADPETIRGAAGAYLESQAEQMRMRSLDVKTDVLEGDPASALHDALLPGDVLVLTSHGRGGIGRWLLGSVAEKMIKHANTPVVVVRAKPVAAS